MTLPCLRERLARPDILIAPGVYDALSALVAEQSGFEAVHPLPIRTLAAPTWA